MFMVEVDRALPTFRQPYSVIVGHEYPTYNMNARPTICVASAWSANIRVRIPPCNT
ncbi:hypothetical protein ACKLNO_07430 [Neisseriaceae bacterium B1]